MDRIFEVIAEINATDKLTILLVEQNVEESLSLVHSGYVIGWSWKGSCFSGKIFNT